MDGKLIIIFVSLLCVTWGETYKPGEYLTQPADIDREVGSIVPGTPPSQGVLKSYDLDLQETIINHDPDLGGPTTYPSVSITSPDVQENEVKETGRNDQVDLTTLELNVETTANEEITTPNKESHLPTQSIPTFQNGLEFSTTTNKTSFDDTTINSQVLDWTTPQYVEDTLHSTALNVTEEAIQPLNEHTSEVVNSTTTDNNPSTTLVIDIVNNPEHLFTPDIDNANEMAITSGSSEPPTLASTKSINENSLSNIEPLIKSQSFVQYPSTTLISPSVNDMTTALIDGEETMVPSEDGEDLIATNKPHISGLSPSSVEPEVFENTTPFVTERELTVTYPIDATNEGGSQNHQSTTEDWKTVSKETTAQEIFFTTPLTSLASTESLTSTAQPNIHSSHNDSAPFVISCNKGKPCSDEEVCVSKIGGCICVSNLNAITNQQLCPISNEHELIKPTQISFTVGQNEDHTTTRCNSVEHRDLEHTFFTRKWKELSVRQKSRNTVTLSFSPAPEVVEWFQNYDGKFRKYLASTLTTCLHDIRANNSDIHHVIPPTDILYLSPSPVRNDRAITVSILVIKPGSGFNNSFADNKIIISCIREVQNEFEAKLQLTITRMEEVFPIRRLITNCSIQVAGLTANTVKLLFVGGVVALTMTVLCMVLLSCKCRRRFDPRTGLYRYPRVLMRSPGDGHNLATDEQCQQDEGQRVDSENGDIIGKLESDTWVVPLEEIESTMERETKPEEDEDTKV